MPNITISYPASSTADVRARFPTDAELVRFLQGELRKVVRAFAEERAQVGVQQALTAVDSRWGS